MINLLNYLETMLLIYFGRKKRHDLPQFIDTPVKLELYCHGLAPIFGPFSMLVENFAIFVSLRCPNQTDLYGANLREAKTLKPWLPWIEKGIFDKESLQKITY